jgi:hypothetical protein
MNYENDIRIDDQALDVEWLGQAELTFKYCKHVADMERAMDKAKEYLDLTRAEVDKDVRENPSKYKIGDIKITEAVVTSAILQSDVYKNAYSEYLDAKFEFGVAKGAEKAFQDRKKALENLVTLFGQNYFAGPSMPRNLSNERTKKKVEDKELNSKIQRRINKK